MGYRWRPWTYLRVDEGAAVGLALEADTAEGEQTRRTALAAALEVEAADAGLAAAAEQIRVLVEAGVAAAQGAAHDDVLLVDGIITSSTHGLERNGVSGKGERKIQGYPSLLETGANL